MLLALDDEAVVLASKRFKDFIIKVQGDTLRLLLFFLFVVFLVRMWLLNACLRLIFRDPVKENLFFAPGFVFTFGISLYKILNKN